MSIVAQDAEAAAETAASKVAAQLEHWDQKHPNATPAQLDQQVHHAVQELANDEHPGKSRVAVTAAYVQDATQRLARRINGDSQSARLNQALNRAQNALPGGNSPPAPVPRPIQIDPADQAKIQAIQEFDRNLQLLRACADQVGTLTAADRKEVDQAFTAMAESAKNLKAKDNSVGVAAENALADAQKAWRDALAAHPTPAEPTPIYRSTPLDLPDK